MSGICLGNVSIDELIRRTGYNVSEEDRKILESHRDDKANLNFNSDRFHIFDLPFTITVGEKFKTKLIEILMKYENETPSKEQLNIALVTESEKEKEYRLKAEKEKELKREQSENPNSVWLIKWYLMVPIIVNNKNYYYSCFINTYYKGRKEDLPDSINGRANVCIDEEGLHGNFTLDEESLIVDNANENTEWNHVVGSGYHRMDGSYLGSHFDDAFFDNVEFSIKECYDQAKCFDRVSRTVWFQHYADQPK